MIPSVAASERGEAQTRELALWGCGTSHMELQRSRLNEEVWKGPPKKVKALYLKVWLSPRCIPSSAGHVKPRMNPAGPSAKAKYFLATDSEAVP